MSKVAWIQSRIWSELRKQPVLTLALSCSTCCGVSLPGSPLWWLAQRASSPALRKTRSHSPNWVRPTPSNSAVSSLVLPAPTARIAVRRWYTRRSRVPLRRRSISFFCSAVNSIVFIAASSVRSFGGLAPPHRLIIPVGFPSATVYVLDVMDDVVDFAAQLLVELAQLLGVEWSVSVDIPL